jgi:hypothetical protein
MDNSFPVVVSGGGGGAGAGAQCFANIAALAAFDTVANPDVCIAFVETVWDFWAHDAASVAPVDGITVIAATGGGNWLRQGVAAQKWADAYIGTQEISSGGDDENTGLVGSPLRTAAEMQRRLGCLNVAGNQIVNIIVGNLGASDMFRKTWTNQIGTELGDFALNGLLTQVATGTVNAVTARVLTTEQSLDITPSATLAAQINRLIRFLVGAGPAIRCEGWIAADLGAGVFRISDAELAGVYVTPVIGDTYQVFTETEIPDGIIDLFEPSQDGHTMSLIRVNNPGGGDFAQLNGWSTLDRCDVNARMYFNNQSSFTSFQNCRYTPPDVTVQGRLFFVHGLMAARGGTTLFDFRGRGNAQLSFFESMFQGVNLRTEQLTLNSETIQSLSFYNAPDTIPWIMSYTIGTIERLRGPLVTTAARMIRNEPSFLCFDNIFTLGDVIEMDSGDVAVSATDLAISGDFISPGHCRIVGTLRAANLQKNAVLVNDTATTLDPGEIVRGIATGFASAQADSATNQTAYGVTLVRSADPSTSLIATSGPTWVLIDGALPTPGNMVWLSSATARQGTAILPANGLVTEIGRCLATLGARALVALNIMVIPTQLRAPYNFDEFEGGSHSSASIGKMGWGFSNGTWVRVGPSAEHPGVMRRTSSGAGALSDWRLSAFSGATSVRQDQCDSQRWVIMPVEDNTDYSVRTGYMTDTADATPTDGVYFESLLGEANWFSVTRAANVETRKDTGIAYVAGTWYTLMSRKNGTGVDFFIDGALVTNHVAAENVPAAGSALIQGGHIVPPALAARNIDFDFWDEQLLIQSR